MQAALSFDDAACELVLKLISLCLRGGFRFVGHRHVNHSHYDGPQKQGARIDRTESQAAIFQRLRKKISERRPERPREDVSQPEGQNTIQTWGNRGAIVPGQLCNDGW